VSSSQHDTFSPQNLSVLGGLLFVALILGEFVFSSHNNDGMVASESAGVGTMEDISMRLAPVISLDSLLAGSAGSGSGDMAQKSPQEMYQSACLACHASGVAGAPKTGDGAAWSARAGNGIDALLTSAINGKGAMPPKGGSTYTDEQLRAVIEYILAESGL
jgi:cytochrome c5